MSESPVSVSDRDRLARLLTAYVNAAARHAEADDAADAARRCKYQALQQVIQAMRDVGLRRFVTSDGRLVQLDAAGDDISIATIEHVDVAQADQ